MSSATPSNPLFVRAARSRGWPSARVTLVLALGLALTSLLIVPQEPFMADSARQLAVLLARITLLLTPLGAAYVAATLTARDMRSQLVELLHLTGISESRLVWGYVAASLYRMRFWLALMLGLTPAFVLGLREVIVVTEYFVWNPPHCARLAEALAVLHRCSIHVPPGPIVVWRSEWPRLWTGVYASLAVGLGGMNLLAATLGVTLALWWRRAASVFVAPFVAGLGTFALIDAALIIGIAGQRLAIGPVLIVAPYLLSAAMLRVAWRWVRR